MQGKQQMKEQNDWKMIHGLNSVKPLTNYVMSLYQFKTLSREDDYLYIESIKIRTLRGNDTDGQTIHLGSNMFASIKPPFHVVHIHQ